MRSDRAPGDGDATAHLADAIGAIGAALLRSSRATSAVEDILRALCLAYDRADLKAFVLPTLVLVEDPGGAPGRTQIFPVSAEPLRLDQAGAVQQLVSRAEANRMPPAEIVRALRKIADQPSRIGPWGRILGHAILTLGFGLVLNPVPSAIPVYVVLGVIVGIVVVFGSRLKTLTLILPVATSFGLTLATAATLAPFVGDDPLRVVAPALVSFLPGLTLTLAAVELTNNQVVAGASRLVYGAAQLGLLVFGVFAAITVLGLHPVSGSPALLGAWAPWLGVVLTAAGYTLFSVAPRGAFPWILGALAVAYGAQTLGAALIGAQLSGFVGALTVILAVNLAGRIRSAPPSAVMLTCAYWLLVPGAIGFIGASDVAEGASGALSLIMQTVVSLVAIAIGMIVGAGVSRDASSMTRLWRGRH